MPKTGKALEHLITTLERELASNGDVTIEGPKRLPDRRTGTLREHDVLLTLKQRHHSIQIAIECRDRSRPITVNDVEGFWAKCQDTGINQGIIVSTVGFYNTARIKAEQLGIRCLDLQEVEALTWMLDPHITSVSKLLHTHWTFFPETKGVVEKARFEVLDPTGEILNDGVLAANAQQQLNRLLPRLPEPVSGGELKVKFEGGGLMLREPNSGAKVNVRFAIAKIQYSVTQDVLPFRLVKYVDKTKDETITDAAVAKLNFGEHSGELMIVYREDKGGRVLFVPTPNKKGVKLRSPQKPILRF